MAILTRKVDFLPENTKLRLCVKPSGNFDKALEEFFLCDSDLKIKNKAQCTCVEIHLDELLKIQFTISKNGNISKECKSCKCSTKVSPDESLTSINHACVRISELVEKEKKSRSINIYENVFFKDNNGDWQLLGFLRDELYKPYEEEFEEQKRIIQEEKNKYTKPLRETKGQTGQINLPSEAQDEIREILESENKDLQQKIQRLSTSLEKSKLTAYKEKLKDFKQRLDMDDPEASRENSWQEWIYKNNWIFGIQYGMHIGHPKVGFRSILDYLFPTPDGFIDILEIKKPSYEVIKEDKSHPGAFKWSGEVNEAIGQVIKYLSEIELHQLIIAQNLKRELSLELSTIKPRAFILIGKSDDWNDTKKEAFRRLNHSLHGIEVLTYTHLLRRGENFIKVYAD
jgi:Domain of unknown function (DUF4263)